MLGRNKKLTIIFHCCVCDQCQYFQVSALKIIDGGFELPNLLLEQNEIIPEHVKLQLNHQMHTKKICGLCFTNSSLWLKNVFRFSNPAISQWLNVWLLLRTVFQNQNEIELWCPIFRQTKFLNIIKDELSIFRETDCECDEIKSFCWIRERKYFREIR